MSNISFILLIKKLKEINIENKPSINDQNNIINIEEKPLINKDDIYDLVGKYFKKVNKIIIFIYIK